MTNLETAHALAAAGYPVFPCEEAGDRRKQPKPGILWPQRATVSVPVIDELWRRWPNAAPGVKIESTPFIVFDCDRKPGAADGVEWFRALCLEHDYDLELVPIVQTPATGWHCYFIRPDGEKLGNGRGSLPPKEICPIDIRGAGGYVVGPGSVTDAGTYEVLDGLDISEAPELPPFLLELLTAAPRVAATAPASSSATISAAALAAARERVTKREEGYAVTALEDECQKIASTSKGGRNEALNVSALKLGSMVGAGWISEGEVRAGLTAAVAGWTDPKKTLGTLERALRVGIGRPRDPLPPAVDDGAVERGNELAKQLDASLDEEAPETADVLAEEVPEEVPQDLPDDFLQVPGLVGEIADWIVATSPTPIRSFAVMTAIVVVGALVARQVYSGPLMTGTHLYAMMLTGTGGGKDRLQTAVDQIMAAVGRADMLVGPLSTSSALASWMANHPAMLNVVDEMSGMLAKMNNVRSSNQEADLLRSYCTIWGRNMRDYRPETTTTRQIGVIRRPWLSFLGFTTFSAFREQMKSKNVANGFMNRFLVVPAHAAAPWNKTPAPSLEVPPEIVARAVALTQFNDAATDRGVEQSALWGQSAPPREIFVPVEPAAEAMLDAVKDREFEIRQAGDRDGNELAEIWSRYAEMVRRMSLILAIGQHPNTMLFCRVKEQDVAWADRFVTWCLAGLERELAQNMADTQHQADMLHVLGIIRKARVITRSELYLKLKGRFNKMAMVSILETLQLGLQIKESKAKKQNSPGPAPIVYTYLRG